MMRINTILSSLNRAGGQIRFFSSNYDGKARKLGFIGLGNMGSSMSINLVKKGFDVTVFDINAEAVKKVKTMGAKVANSSSELAKNVDCIITMLPASPHLKSLYLGENGLLRHINKGKFIIDTSTIDPSATQELSKQFAQVGAKFIDAPVSGGIKAAELGSLTFMVGGETNAVEEAKPILLAMGAKVIHCGQAGSGQIAKTCNNLLLGITMAGVSEAMNLGVKLGLDPKLLASVINCSSGRCWSSDTYNPVPGVMEDVPSSKDYKAGFTANMLAKDLRIANNAANELDVDLTMGKKTLEIYQELCDENSGEKDFSIVYKHFKEKTKNV